LSKTAKDKEWPDRKATFGAYFPKSELRIIPGNVFLYSSVIANTPFKETLNQSEEGSLPGVQSLLCQSVFVMCKASCAPPQG
jgi:hypothetical protein